MGFELLWIVLVACLIACSVGFIKYVYFMSVGYGFAIAVGGIVVAVLFRDSLGWVAVCQMLLFIAYGARLSGFLVVRELKSAAYRKTLGEATKTEKPLPIFVMIAMWLFMGSLYTAQLSPMFYRLYNGADDTAVPAVGMAVSLLGLTLEALADKQKSEQKSKNPNMVATEGLYRMVRCPNYLGEIIFWTGVLIASTTALQEAGQWIMELVAWVLIVLIMVHGAYRLEKRQMQRYGKDPAYNAYANRTPIIFPFIPLYHLNKQ